MPAAQWNQQWLGTTLPSEAPTLCCGHALEHTAIPSSWEFTSKGNGCTLSNLCLGVVVPTVTPPTHNFSLRPDVCSPSVPWMGTQKCKAAPQSFLGSHDLKHQNMEQLDKPGRSTAFHQEAEDLSMGNKRKSTTNINTPLVEKQRR